MSNFLMYGELQLLDCEVYKNLKLDIGKVVVVCVVDQNFVFFVVVEFGDVCKEYFIVFVCVGEGGFDGKFVVVLLVVLGLKFGFNFFVGDDKWIGIYVLVYVCCYFFVMVWMDGNFNNLVVCFDSKWVGFNEMIGEVLFKDGQLIEFFVGVKNFLENFE